ncbi:MAG: aminotransferase class V-fold PLP-dependent enzyme [Spirochaetaceae bacterium]|jgi:cysteine desulfurase family protein|nr:aminotransferase class V-fold PLP-dependent enzyme [Spirochaetaceae bacterium]
MIYANYAATSPRLDGAIVKELCLWLNETHLAAARNFDSLEAGAVALRARKAAAKLFGAPDLLKVIFTSGATQSLNMAINGLVRPGCHVLASSLEHNSCARPLEALRKSGFIQLDWVPCAADGSLDCDFVRRAIKKNTRLLVMTHASNVLGTILPVEECSKIAGEHGLFFILDAAQTAGVLPVSLGGGRDVIAFTAHKGLGALAGSGGLVIGDEAAREMRPWILGGSGSASHSLSQPDFTPDKFEAGTQNAIGVLSLAVAIEEIISTGVEKIREKEAALTAIFIEGLREIKKVKIHGTGDARRCTAVVSASFQGFDSGVAARLLFEKAGVVTRSGLHCSPLAHKTAGTYPGGTVRFSFGRGTAREEIDAILAAVRAL